MPGQFDDLRRRVRGETNSRRHSPLRDLNDSGFDRFTERARKVLTYAQDEARRLNHNYIGTEHLLLGLVREHDGIAGRVLADLGVNLERVRQEVEHIIGRADRVITGPVGMTPRSKQVVELAVDEAQRMGHRYIGTEHLLLGLVREGEGIAAGVLASFGLRLQQVRTAVLAELAQRSPEPMPAAAPSEPATFGAAPSGPKNNVVTCRLDDRAVEALDALVEAGIRSTRSDAAAWLIAAGIEAHRPLFDRVQATIAEIRRLRTEAQQIAQQVTSEQAAAGAAGIGGSAEPGAANIAPDGESTTTREEPNSDDEVTGKSDPSDT